MHLNTVIVDYLNALRVEQGATAATHKGYQAQLRHFHKWLIENGYPEPTVSDFTTPVCRRFLYALSSRNLRPRTLRSYFHPLVGLGEFLISNGLLTENPAKGVTLPKKDAALRETVSDAEVMALLEACERQRNKRRVACCRAVLCTLIYGGLRRAEVCDPLVADVNTAEKSVLVRMGKGQKSRRVYLPDEAIAALKEWLALRWTDCKHPYLFATDTRLRMSFMGLAALVEDVKALAGLETHDNIKPHSLRHWRATDLMRAGADLRSIQAFLGHAQLNTTAYKVTEAAKINSLPDTPIEYEITPAGRGDYLPSRGKFKEGEDARRHQFTRAECQKGYHNAINSLLRRFPGCDPHFLMCAITGAKPWHKLPEIQYLMQRDEPLTNAEAMRLFARE